MKKIHLGLLLLAVFAVSNAPAQDTWYYPPHGAEWESRAPRAVGINASRLSEAVAFAEAHEYSGPRDLRRAILEGFQREPFHEILGPVKKRGGPAGMILKNGYMVASWGDIRRVDMTFSVTKSFLSTVAGVASDQGLLQNTQAPVGETIWDGTFSGAHNAKITWAHLLQQNSDWSGSLWGLHDWADRPPREGGLDDWRFRELREPGTVMEYNDVRVNVLAYSLTHLWRQPLPAVLKTHIMDPIGASTTWRWFGYDHAWTTIDGYKMQSVTGGGHSGAGIFISAEDMARFGLLFLSDGKWDGKQLISPEWIREATTPSAPNPNYGYMWWLNQQGPRHWEGVPENVYYAAGFGGNFIVVAPDQDVVMVLRWLEPSEIGAFVAKVFEALP
ncbi:serine hydrolase [Robiginitalea sp. M366]|uniref:serine hydrolase domain-containing protein n=1 Tax=Robiginitalea aestuariiviva TaxID=3036903 RepID=UPI00240D9529|nr:serine hydrolase [Robiginitalea aestuariiviva]MDG1571418.1 serine hydrolase [Robiginitalea aestuariiviva]